MQEVKNWLIPGGLGFVGSHTVVEILQRTSANVVIVDNLSNCYADVYDRVKQILSSKLKPQEIQKRMTWVNGDIMDINFLDSLFKKYKEELKHPIQGIMHFAALKCVTESCQIPLTYFSNNIIGSINLFKMMEKYTDCKHFIFSSTSAAYGHRDNCKETDEPTPLNPYALSKLNVETILKQLSKVHPDWKIIILRYFNPVGAHSSGLIGDEPSVFPNNLFPFIQQVIVGKRECLSVYGSDYPTPDGTCIRDYIDITDIAIGHVAALQKVYTIEKFQIINLGSGNGYSVLEIVKGFQKALGKPIKYKLAERRLGDGAKLVANIEKADKFLNWKPTKNIDQMCNASLNFALKRYNKTLEEVRKL